ncbi:phenylacetic acid degradation protein PaaN [Stackebrandtia nassauensis]|uniref:Phenylacetic acid degradation protein paaN n=1 Tax=Stackebrandtia nassauensis (strain DSM 44728 / CIP 108903 / NRRL B-16338 / NBRC 102104 / LLR-40K-21) TaxID=446470 RepID=D3Q1F6_STANL|nr:phenylacetic acid degradation protein PaaN [Stackebrandtia nassauensis]ADD45736.1 phenylacetic acid degradation protein paaN [Stackebrandtia nassauensis DSM 44728]
MTHPLLAKHRDTLDNALAAIADRGYFSIYPESPSPRVYGETAADDGKAAFTALLGQRFDIDQPGVRDHVATEDSPFGIDLGVEYPRTEPGALIDAATAAWPSWRDADPATRAGVCIEILERIHKDVFTMANAVHATTGQPFVMAFQAGGPHALDRGLEGVAYGYFEQTRTPATSYWEKPAGKGQVLAMEKTFTVVPRGVALVVACATFPTWNSYPGLFASLVTGNPVIVKPHPNAVLPLALTVRHAREVLAEAGFDPNLVTLAAERPDDRIAASLATDPRVRIVDFTGSTSFGTWLEDNARHAAVYTEKAGVNTVVIDSTEDFKGLCRNLAFTLCLYSGQMCTTTQAIFLPSDGIDTPEGHLSADEVIAGIAGAVEKLTGDDAKAVELIGAVSAGVADRVGDAAGLGEVVLASRAITHPSYPDARVRTPLLLKVTAEARKSYGTECFGPIAFFVTTSGTAESLNLVREVVTEQGALTMGVYSTDDAVLDATEQVSRDVAVHLSRNLYGGVFVNQTAAFSDFHASGGNPAANASLVDGAYVSGRFRVIESRRHVPPRANSLSRTRERTISPLVVLV